MNKKFLAALLSAAIAMTAMTASVYGAADTESNFVRDSESPVSVQYEADATSEEGGPPNAVYVSETVEDAGTSSGDFLEDVVDELEPVDTDALLTAAQASLLEMQDGVAVIDMEELQVVNMDESGETERFAVFYGARIVTGWQQESGYWYYYKNGSKVTGWLELVESGTTYYYYLDPSYGGRMVTGLKTITSGGVSRKYYFTANGPMAHGWYNLKLSGDSAYYYYYFGVPGNASTGYMRISEWLQDTETSPVYWYYLDSKGHMLSYAWLSQNGERYYFAGDGHMISSTFYTIGSNYYYFTDNGAVETGWFKLGGNTYRASSTGILSRGTVKLSDYVNSVFDSSGRWLSDQLREKTASMHAYPYNVRVKNWVILDGYKQASAYLCGTSLDAIFPGITQDVIDYYNDYSENLVHLQALASYDGATIALKSTESSAIFSDGTYATTYSRNSDKQWFGGAVVPDAESKGAFEVGEITYSEIHFYKEYVNSSTSAYDQRYLSRHEVGHALGLRHTFESRDYTPPYDDAPNTVALMHPFISNSNRRDTFQDYDYEELRKTYPQ